MPQMSPLMWGTLFLMFSAFLLISLTKMFFFSSKKPVAATQHHSTLNTPKMTWLW